MDYDILIVGSGPAGLTAGMYAARGGLKTGILTGAVLGGQVSLIDTIENYSGIASIDGFSLISAMRGQAESFGAELIEGGVREFSLSGSPKTLLLEDDRELRAESVILAMGTHHKTLGLPNEQALTGRGVSYCATCDGNFFRKKAVAVIGGGNSAFTEALYLARIASKVYLVHKRSSFRAANALVERAAADPNIEIITDSMAAELEGNPLSAVVIKNVQTGELRKLEVKGLFVAIGALPNTAALAGQIALDEFGAVPTAPDMSTNIENVYAAGDLRATPLRQIVTACADGAIAADAAIRKRLRS